ncbi:hypothetical protein NUW58_g5264 [Xylaria curta]|uniref:Uncharacterized protein n=1 Tax=Xylaria curta TaxID=42375 RepID=A0ACC1P3P7_9PEZI|nr:hypothetical protein NUW58_g5264 [Xylaria curta]
MFVVASGLGRSQNLLFFLRPSTPRRPVEAYNSATYDWTGLGYTVAGLVPGLNMDTAPLETVVGEEEVPNPNKNDGGRQPEADVVLERENSALRGYSGPNVDFDMYLSVPKRRPTQPIVRKVNFEGFKNRFSEEECYCAIEVLVAGANINHDIRQEMLMREEYQQSLAKGRYRGRPFQAAPMVGTLAENTDDTLKPEDGGWIQRVRIQSQPILIHLAKVVGETWQFHNSRTFYRPFSVFIYFQSKMKEALVELERKWGEDGHRKMERGVGREESGTQPQENARTDQNEMKSAAEEDFEDCSAEAIANSVGALRDMRCYVNFVDNDIAPLYKQFEGTAPTKIRFDDLWLLFRVGESVFASEASAPAMPSSKPKHTTMYQQLWRVYTLNNPTKPFQYPTLHAEFKPSRASNDTDEDGENSEAPTNCFKVWAYYIDHDGDSYGAVKHEFSIQRYEGEKDIANLPCFPTRFMKHCDDHLQELKKQGEKFQMCIEKRHIECNGWTLATNPDGMALPRVESTGEQRPLHPEYIDSHVIVDFAEAYYEVPDRKPAFHHPLVYSDDWAGTIDAFPIKQWANRQRTKLVYQWDNEIVQTADGVDMWQRREGLAKDTFLQTYNKRQHRQARGSELKLTDEDIMLLPRRLFAYVLRYRKFVAVDLQYLAPVQEQKDVFNNLKIRKDYKDMVKGLVASHFIKRRLEQEFFRSLNVSRSQGIIQGRSSSLVILLHGVPGVGKTATAEAVALEYQKPLFVITCGDLGLTPREVEESLTESFRLAHLWDCVLLLDEADVFLTQRSRFDLKRNALVSVFLRILEYYNGILFLTTNRVGVLDEAFKSRIHMSLYYPPLDEPQVKQIFIMNINRVIDIEKERSDLTNKPAMDVRSSDIESFADTHCQKTKNEGGRWNGRQIRNAFEIASSLARYDSLLEYEKALDSDKDATEPVPVLDKSQFEKVERATVEFERYMKHTKGYNDADFGQTPKFGLGVGGGAFPYQPPSQFAEAEAADGSQYGEAVSQEYYSDQYSAGVSGIQFSNAQPGPMNFGTGAGISNTFQHGIGGSQVSPGPDPFVTSRGHGYGRQTRQGHAGNSAAMSCGGYSQHDAIDASQYEALPQGSVIGVDSVEKVLQQARDLASERGVEGNLEFQRCDANELPFGDGEFDIVFCHQVLHHVHDPVAILKEMTRVTRKGGHVAAREVDYGSLAWYPELPGLNKWEDVHMAVFKANGAQPRAGRYVKAWAMETGFAPEDITFTWGLWNYQDDEAVVWANSWVDRSLNSSYASTSLEKGIATQEDLNHVSESWREWGGVKGAFVVIPSDFTEDQNWLIILLYTTRKALLLGTGSRGSRALALWLFCEGQGSAAVISGESVKGVGSVHPIVQPE